MRREKEKKTGRWEDAVLQWTSVILTSLLLYCDVLHEETASGFQTTLCFLCLHSFIVKSLTGITLMSYFNATIHASTLNLYFLPYSYSLLWLAGYIRKQLFSFCGFFSCDFSLDAVAFIETKSESGATAQHHSGAHAVGSLRQSGAWKYCIRLLCE